MIIRAGSDDLYVSKRVTSLSKEDSLVVYTQSVCSTDDEKCIRVISIVDIPVIDVRFLDYDTLIRVLSSYRYMSDLRDEGVGDDDPDEVLRREYNNVASLEEFFRADDSFYSKISNMFAGCSGFALNMTRGSEEIIVLVLCPLETGGYLSLFDFKEDVEPVYAV